MFPTATDVYTTILQWVDLWWRLPVPLISHKHFFKYHHHFQYFQNDWGWGEGGRTGGGGRGREEDLGNLHFVLRLLKWRNKKLMSTYKCKLSICDNCLVYQSLFRNLSKQHMHGDSLFLCMPNTSPTNYILMSYVVVSSRPLFYGWFQRTCPTYHWPKSYTWYNRAPQLVLLYCTFSLT